MTQDEIKESKLKLDGLDRSEEERIKLIDKKNALESLIYEKSNWLSSENANKVILL